jgi:protein-L-isoaspartate(D-aspartate) O-methyltransferase
VEHDPPNGDPHDYARLRRQMVQHQIRGRGVRDERVLEAMLAVPRERFVPPELRAMAYDDCPEPIGAGQTISQPYTVAYMAEAARLQGDEKVLEVGAGSGYGAAVLGQLAAEVHSIERLPELARRAAATLQELQYENVRVHVGDGTLGLPDEAPFDVILVTAGAAYLPPAYPDQLADGGRIVIPIGKYQASQRLCRYRRLGDQLPVEDLGGFVFVPLIGAKGWQTDQ